MRVTFVFLIQIIKEYLPFRVGATIQEQWAMIAPLTVHLWKNCRKQRYTWQNCNYFVSQKVWYSVLVTIIFSFLARAAYNPVENHEGWRGEQEILLGHQSAMYIMGYKIHCNLILDHHWLVSLNYWFNGYTWYYLYFSTLRKK